MFLAVGAVNTLTGLLVIFACKWLLGFGDVLANAIGYGVGLTTSFALNRSWTFKHKQAALPAVFRFLAVFLLAYLVNLVTVLLAVRSFSVNSYLAQAIGIVPYTAVSYLGSSRYVFRHRRTLGP